MRNKIINHQSGGFSYGYFLLGIFFVVLFLLIGLFWYNQSRVVLGINLPNQKIGGTRVEKIDQKLDDYFELLGRRKVLVSGANRSFLTNLKDLGVIFSKEKTKKKLLSFGHQGSSIDQFALQIEFLFLTRKIDPVISIDEDKFRSLIKKNLPGTEIDSQDAMVKYNSINGDFEVVSSQVGQKVKIDVLLNNVRQIINQRLDGVGHLQLELKIIQPKIKVEDVIHLASQANKIIGGPITIVGGKEIFKIKRDLVAEWISFPVVDGQPQLSFDRKKIRSYLIKISSRINQAPINARVTFEDGKVKIFQLAHWGKEINIEKSISNLESGLSRQQRKIKLVIDPIKPLIADDQDIKKLGIESLLAVGESDFSGSPANRIHNIKIGVSKISGLLIKPNEEFSFDRTLGEINKKSGYLPELVIKNHRVVPELGGGLCQVSTTVFRAAVRAGLIITERQPHAFPVVYYNPQGFDATIYSHSPDLRFINNTPNYLLVQTKIEDHHLYVYFYGTNDQRRVEIIGPKVLKNTLKIRKEGKLIDNPQGILKTVLTEKVWRNGKIVYQKNFWSIYHSPLSFGE